MSRHAATRTRSVGSPERRDLRRAWVSVLLLPVAYVVAVLLGEGVLGMLGYPSGPQDSTPVGYALLVGIPAVAIAITPGVAAYVFGMRARRGGVASGIFPAVIGATVGVGFVLLNLAAFLVGR